MIETNEFVQKTEELVSNLKRLVEIESPTREKAAVDRVGALVAEEFSRLGAEITVERQPLAGDHIIARWGSRQNDSGILTLCHMDTVHPIGSILQNPCVRREDRLYGPGAVDMKAGIAMLFVALKTLKEKGQWPQHPITALFTSDEETGSLSSRPLIEQLASRSLLVLCLEPCLPDGSLKTWRKGVGNFQMSVRGRASHAGAAHADGRNAIEEIAHQVIAIQRLTDYDKGTTLNVGVIRGGTTSNVVPEEALAEIDFRVMAAAEAERVLHSLQKLTPVLEGTSIEIKGGLNRPPMPRDERMVATFQKAQKIAAEIGIALTEGGTGGGSDANFVTPLGVPVLDGLGARGEGQHTGNEYVWISSLAERTALLANLISGFFPEGGGR